MTEYLRPALPIEYPKVTDPGYRYFQQIADVVNSQLTLINSSLATIDAAIDDLQDQIDAFAPTAPSVTWNALSLDNSWVNYGGSEQDAEYCKDWLGWVHIRGTVKNGSWNARIATLPSGYYPADQLNFPTQGYNRANATLQIRTNGDVYIYSAVASNDYLYLDPVHFYVG